MATTTTRTKQVADWRCPTCGRTFRRTAQQHSCRRVPLEDHLKAGDARSRFEQLLAVVRRDVGPCEVLSLPCCIHLVGSYDFLAVLPRPERLEIHLALERELDDPRILASNRLSATSWMHRVDLRTDADLDELFLDWVREAYHLRDR
jgi:hypothetical protein